MAEVQHAVRRYCQWCGVPFIGNEEFCCDEHKIAHYERVQMQGMKHDPERRPEIDHPEHYGGADDPYEAIKVIEAWELNFNTGNAVKYICRAGKKPNVKAVVDLEKAVWYLQREIAKLKVSDG